MKGTDHFKRTIQMFLEQRAAEDELFAKTAGRLLQGIRHGNKREPVLQYLCGHQAAEERQPHLFLRQGCGEIEPADAGGRGTGTDAEKITRK